MSVVPLATFEIHTINDATICWLFSDVFVSLIIMDLVPELKSIDSYYMLSSVVLQSSGQESLREEES